MTAHEPDHQSIGEVLATLRDEFPDITISKIRFLESQGLIDPERTPSGYRKFRDNDVGRLSWILAQQKQNFLPLKVIKARLDAAGPDALPPDIEPTAAELGTPGSDAGAQSAGAASEAKPKRTRAPKTRTTTTSSEAGRASSKPRAGSGSRATKTPTAKVGTTAVAADPALFDAQMLPLDDGTTDDLALDPSGASLTRRELAQAAGLTDAQLADLEEYGMLAPAAGSGDRVVFDEQALVVARLAAEFAAHGIGPRHLRMFRVFAEREAGLYDQVIAPRLRRRNPEARAQARDDLVDLARLGRAMRAAYLRSATAGMLKD